MQRADDNKDVVLERLKVYQRATRPVLEYYRERPTFRVVNGAQAPERVAHELDTMIDDAANVGAAMSRMDGGRDCLPVAGRDREAAAGEPAGRPRSWPSCAQMAAPGVTTQEIDAVAEARVRAAGAEPAFKGYHGYPATICASVNEQVVHGIPSTRKLVEGDILSIDMGAKLDGFFGDCAVTVPIGTVCAGGGRAAAGDRGRRCSAGSTR